MNLFYFKIVAIFFIIIVAQAGAFLAVKTKDFKRGSLYLSLGNIFLPASFLARGLFI